MKLSFSGQYIYNLYVSINCKNEEFYYIAVNVLLHEGLQLFIIFLFQKTR